MKVPVWTPTWNRALALLLILAPGCCSSLSTAGEGSDVSVSVPDVRWSSRLLAAARSSLTVAGVESEPADGRFVHSVLSLCLLLSFSFCFSDSQSDCIF